MADAHDIRFAPDSKVRAQACQSVLNWSAWWPNGGKERELERGEWTEWAAGSEI